MMGSKPTTRLLWTLFADLLEYPHESPVELLRDCRALARDVSHMAEVELAEFQAFAETATLGRLQEEYTRAFDMDETHSLYVGFHLLGETYKRSALLLELKERYRAYDIEVAGELSDHLPVVLRYLAVCEDEHATAEILGEAVWPMLDMMAVKDKKSQEAAEQDEDHPPVARPPYHKLLAALRLVVDVSPRAEIQPMANAIAVGWPNQAKG